MEYNSEHLSKLWILYLREKGVKLPKDGKLREALNYLFQNMGTYRHIDAIKEHVASKYTLTGTDPLQVRHLSTQFGWNIVKKGRYEHCLESIFMPSPSFIPDRRGDKLTNEMWDDLKRSYDYMCVNCGSKDGEPMRWDKTVETKLQKGHMDPDKDLTEDNCVPQCGFCNQRYKDKAVFDKRGQIIKLKS